MKSTLFADDLQFLNQSKDGIKKKDLIKKWRTYLKSIQKILIFQK